VWWAPAIYFVSGSPPPLPFVFFPQLGGKGMQEIRALVLFACGNIQACAHRQPYPFPLLQIFAPPTEGVYNQWVPSKDTEPQAACGPPAVGQFPPTQFPQLRGSFLAFSSLSLSSSAIFQTPVSGRAATKTPRSFLLFKIFPIFNPQGSA